MQKDRQTGSKLRYRTEAEERNVEAGQQALRGRDGDHAEAVGGLEDVEVEKAGIATKHIWLVSNPLKSRVTMLGRGAAVRDEIRIQRTSDARENSMKGD